MIEPPGSVDNPILLADWVELSALTSDPAQIAQDDVASTLMAAGLAGFTDGGLPDEERLSDELDQVGQVAGVSQAELVAEGVFAELRQRANALKQAYPFHIDDGLICLNGESWREWPAFTSLLLLSTSQIFGAVMQNPNDAMRRYFEKIVEAAARNAFHGASQRFGWPREPDWPTHPHARVSRLAELIGREVLSLANVDPTDNDKGLDVVVGLEMGYGRDGVPWTLIQCGSGANWAVKKGEPSLSEWNSIINWLGPTSRGLAIPFRLAGHETYARVSRRFDASVVLDLPRLQRAHPDEAMDPAVLNDLREWCGAAIASLPVA